LNGEINSNPKKKKRWQMTNEERVRDFQRNLYQKAKQEPEFRFYALYDKVKLDHFLYEAYRRVKANRGAPGVDNITFKDIETKGLEGFIENVQKELESRTYRPKPVKRVMIPKANGKMRPLGIPTIKDRVVQMSCKMVIEPIFEADFEETSYGFRPKRSAKEAIAKIKQNLKEGKTQVYDADLSAYFDTIPHGKLLILIGLRISDKYIIHLIKMWLKAPVMEDGKMSGGKKNKVGTPQGGVISPLLANIYLHLIDKLVNNTQKVFVKCGVTIVRYADDFVLMGKRISEKVLIKLKDVLGKMELSINYEKSKMIEATKEAFSFLGFTFRYDKDIKDRQWKYWNVIPSDKALKKAKENIAKYLQKRGHFPPNRIVKDLNSKIRGWINYFTINGISYPAVAKRKLRWYMVHKIDRYYKKKSQRKCKLYGYNAFNKLVEKYQLIDPTKYSKWDYVKA
jgi:group II intron reverse transcriptase/maturase